MGGVPRHERPVVPGRHRLLCLHHLLGTCQMDGSTIIMAKILIGCEFSGTVRDAFAALGHDAWSCDLLPSEKPGNHLQCDIFSILDQGWDMMVFHWPCTHLTRAAALWLYHTPKNPTLGKLYGQPRRQAMIESAQCFRRLLDCKIPKVCGENPIPYRDAHTIMGHYTQKIQPFQFGHPERKATCLWLRSLPPLLPTNIVPLPAARNQAQRLFHLPPSPTRWMERSRTFSGIAAAMAQQWGSLL